MFKGVFERLLVCGMLLCGLVPATLSADVLEALRPEAQAYLQQLAVLEQRPEDGRLLVQAAELMVDATDCRTAVRLLERAARLGAMRQDADWLRFAQVAGCAGAWREASWLAWRVLQETRSGQRIAAWALLGESLEQISDWRRDWKAEALHAYRTVLAEVEVDWVRERAAKLQQAVDYQQALRVVEHFAERDQRWCSCSTTGCVCAVPPTVGTIRSSCWRA
jgi:hypothetical protein